MSHSKLLLPSLLQRVDADLTGFRHVGVEDLGEHGTCVLGSDSTFATPDMGR